MRLFDLDPVKPTDHLCAATLSEIAILYTATEKGNSTGPRFFMSIEDARRWCSDPVSQGVLHGTRWAYFFTSVHNYVQCHWGTQKPVIDLRRAVDDGSWDERIAAAGCTKIPFAEAKEILAPLGVDLVIPK